METQDPYTAEVFRADITDDRAVINALANAAALAQRLAEQGPDLYS